MSERLLPGVPSFNIDAVYRFIHYSTADLVRSLQEQLGYSLLSQGTMSEKVVATDRTLRVVEYQHCGWPAICPIDEAAWTLHNLSSADRLEKLVIDLEIEYVLLGLYDTAASVEYKHIRSGGVIDHVVDNGEAGEMLFSSLLREECDTRRLPYEYIDAAVTELGIVVPTFYSPFERAGKTVESLEVIDAYYESITDAYLLVLLSNVQNNSKRM